VTISFATTILNSKFVEKNDEEGIRLVDRNGAVLETETERERVRERDIKKTK